MRSNDDRGGKKTDGNVQKGRFRLARDTIQNAYKLGKRRAQLPGIHGKADNRENFKRQTVVCVFLTKTTGLN